MKFEPIKKKTLSRVEVWQLHGRILHLLEKEKREKNFVLRVLGGVEKPALEQRNPFK